MGLHPEIIVIVLIVLAILGPKSLQSLARNTGKGVSQAKNMKNKVISELPMEEIAEVTRQIPRVPTHPHEVVELLMGPEPKEKTKETKSE